MPDLPRQGRLRVRRDGDAHELLADGERVGRFEGTDVEVGGLEAVVEDAGSRRVLRRGRASVLRLDPGGRKATTLTLPRARYRLARQRNLPGLRSWVLTEDVAGQRVLGVRTTPLGTSVAVDDDHGLAGDELELLVAGALVVALGG